MANPTPADAEVILHLYELRTESVMRVARKFVLLEFWPKSAEDAIKLFEAIGTDQNAYIRQTVSYWEMAASLALHGAVNFELFSDAAGGELFFLYAKFKPMLKEIRAINPQFMLKVEEVVNRSKENQERVERITQMIARITAPKK